MTIKQRALLKHRLIMQAAFCVEDLLLTTEKGARRRPWLAIVYDHMESLFPQPRKFKPKKEIVYGTETK